MAYDAVCRLASTDDLYSLLATHLDLSDKALKVYEIHDLIVKAIRKELVVRSGVLDEL